MRLLFVLLLLVACSKPVPPGPSPKSSFVVDGQYLHVEGQMKDGSSAQAAEVAIGVAVDLLEKK